MSGLRRFLGNAWQLGRKELASLRYEPVLLFLLIYSFTFNVYSAAEDASLDAYERMLPGEFLLDAQDLYELETAAKREARPPAGSG